MARRAMSLAALTVLELDPADQVRVAGRVGYSHVGIRLIPATASEPDRGLMTDRRARAGVRAAMAETGVRVLDIEILRLTPDVNVAAFEPVLAVGAELGARFALVAGNDPDTSRLADNFAALCALAARFAVIPHIEFMPFTDVATLADAIALCDAAGSARAGILVDAFHLDRSGGRAADLPADLSRFHYLQLCDIAGPIPGDMAAIVHEARSERLNPGEGRIDLGGLLARFPDDLPISIEVPRDTLRDRGVRPETRAAAALHATLALCDRRAAAA